MSFASRNGEMTLTVPNADSRGRFTQSYTNLDLTLVAEGTPFFGVSLAPQQAFTNDTITATIVASAPTSNVNYDFRVNDVSVQSGASNTFDLSVAGQGDKNDIITVVATNGDGQTNQNSAKVFNSKPVAQGSVDNNAQGGTLLSIPLSGTDLDGDALTFQIVAGARNGVAAIRQTDGASFLDYTGRATFTGTENIQIVANDGEATSPPATIRINVTGRAPNRPATAQDATANAKVGEQIDIPIVVSDPDGDPITIQRVGGPSNGTGSFVKVGDGFVFRYTSRADFIGTDTVRFVAQDGNAGGNSGVATITINVTSDTPLNTAPMVSDSSGAADAGVQTIFRLNVTDDGPASNLFTKSVGGPRNGTGFFRYDRASDSPTFVYTSRTGFSGTETVRFVVNDEQGAQSNIGTLTITVTDRTPTPNRVPVVNSTKANATAGVTIDIPLGINDDGPLSELRVTSPQADATGLVNTRKGSGRFFFVGGRFVFRYTSDADASGVDKLTFFATDAQGSRSNVASIGIRVSNDTPPANRAPVAFSRSIQVTSGQSTDIPLNANDPDAGDTIDTLTFALVSKPPAGNARLVTIGGRPFVRYTPVFASGFDTVTFAATDRGGLTSNNASISIRIVSNTPPVNRAPVAFSASTSATAGQSVDILPNANDPDAGDTIGTLAFSNVRGPLAGTLQILTINGRTVFRYTPRSGFVGLDAISFIATDRAGLPSNVATIGITVTSLNPTPPNRAPFAYSTAITVRANSTTDIAIPASDPDAADTPASLRFIGISGPFTGNLTTLLVDGVPTFRYRAGTRNDSITFVAVDRAGASSNRATVSFVVDNTPIGTPGGGGNTGGNVNRVPVATSSSATATAGVSTDIPVTASDADGDPLTFRIVNGPTGGTGSFVVVSGRTVYRYTARANFSGIENVTFTATDNKGATSSAATLKITVSAANPTGNRAPVAVTPKPIVVPRTFQVSIPVVGIDPDGDRVTFRVLNQPQGGTGSLRVGGAGGAVLSSSTFPNAPVYYVYNSNNQFNGAEQIRFVAIDDKGNQSQPATITISVTGNAQANRAPTADSRDATVIVGQTVDIPVTGGDPDGDTFGFEFAPDNTAGQGIGSFVATGAGWVLRYNPTNPTPGTKLIRFRTRDNRGAISTVATLTINVVSASSAAQAVSASSARKSAPEPEDEEEVMIPSGGSS